MDESLENVGFSLYDHCYRLLLYKLLFMFKLEVANNGLQSQNGFLSLTVSGIDFSNPALVRSKK